MVTVISYIFTDGMLLSFSIVTLLIRGSYQTIWSFPLTNVKWHSVTWPYTMTTPYWSDFVPNSTFYRILSGFHRSFATGVACRHRTLTPPDTLSRPFGTCIGSTCWDQSFSELVIILPGYALRISLVLFRFCLIEKVSSPSKSRMSFIFIPVPIYQPCFKVMYLSEGFLNGIVVWSLSMTGFDGIIPCKFSFVSAHIEFCLGRSGFNVT